LASIHSSFFIARISDSYSDFWLWQWSRLSTPLISRNRLWFIYESGFQRLWFHAKSTSVFFPFRRWAAAISWANLILGVFIKKPPSLLDLKREVMLYCYWRSGGMNEWTTNPSNYWWNLLMSLCYPSQLRQSWQNYRYFDVQGDELSFLTQSQAFWIEMFLWYQLWRTCYRKQRLCLLDKRLILV